MYWSKEDVGDSGWHEGWYMAVVKEVMSYIKCFVKIAYVVEPLESYEIDVKELLKKGFLTLSYGDELEQFFEVGARIKIKWTKDDIGDSNWKPGWYVGEVQQSDLDNDEITVQFVSEPTVTYEYEVTTLVAEGKLKMSKSLF